MRVLKNIVFLFVCLFKSDMVAPVGGPSYSGGTSLNSGLKGFDTSLGNIVRPCLQTNNTIDIQFIFLFEDRVSCM